MTGVMRVLPAWAAALGVFIVPTLAIYFPRSMAVTCGLIGLAVALAAWGRKPWARPDRPLLAAFVLLAAWGALSSLWALDAKAAWRDFGVILASLSGAVVFGAAAAGLDQVERRRILWAFAAGMALALAVTALELAFDGIFLRYRATYQMDLGGVMKPGNTVAMVLLAPALAVLTALGRSRLAAVLGLGWVAVTPFLFSEASKIGLAALAATALLVWRAPRWGTRLACLGLAAIVLALPLLSLAGPTAAEAWERYPWLKNSAHHRLAIWRFTSEHIAEKPLLGWGLSGSRFIPGADDVISYSRPIPGGLFSWFHEANLPLHPHNAALQWWLELGGVGAVLGVAVLVVLVRLAARSTADPVRRALGVATVVGASAISMTAYGAWQGWWLCVLALAAMLLVMARADEHRP